MTPFHCIIAGLTLSTSAMLGLTQEPGTIVEYDESIRDFMSEGTGYSDIDLAGYFKSQDPDVAIWYQHVNTLANPWMQGRQPGTPGDDLASEYLEFHLDYSGLEPGFVDENGEPSWRQPFTFQMRRRAPSLDSSEVVDFTGNLVYQDDYTVLANSGNGDVTAPLTFVGYAIEDGEDGYDSFGDDDDLSGRIAVMLRYEPLDSSGISRWADENFSQHAGIRQKMQAVLDRNPAGVIMVTPPKAIDGRSGLESLQSSQGYRPRASVPVIHLDAKKANALLKQAHPNGNGLEQLRRAADRDRIDTLDLSDDVEVTLRTKLKQPGMPARNIGGMIPGRGELADEWLIVGGHYDHLGTGYTGSRRRNSSEYHNGADDNASGTASVLVFADRLAEFSRESDVDHRSIMFLGFGAEEAGLHGSKYFVNNPPMPLEKVTCMINFDMMGRLGEKGLQLLGTGTAEEFDEMLPRHVSKSELVVNSTPGGSGPSDHASFYAAEMPVLFFFSGITDEYHTPDDEAWTVNPQGAIAMIDLAEDLAKELITREDLLTFKKNSTSAPRRGTGSRVRLGVMPSYDADIETGVMIDGVSDNTSASDAGLQSGDIMLSWNGDPLEGAGTLMEKLRASSPGDKVEVTVMRKGQLKKLEVKLRGIND